MKIPLVALALVALAAPPAAAQTTWRFIVPVVVSQISSSVSGGYVRCEVGPTSGSTTLRISDTTHFAIDETGAFSGDLTVEIVTTDPVWAPGAGERQACYLYLIGPLVGTTTTAEIPSETSNRPWARPNTANPFDIVWVRVLP